MNPRLWLALAAGPFACGAEVEPGPAAAHPGEVWFEERAAQAGLDFVHRSGHREAFYLPEITAGGVGLLDADGDGALDLYLVQSGSLDGPSDNAPGNALYLNGGDWTFRDVSEQSGADDRGYGVGVATGDYDGDGRTDLYVTNVGPNALLRNLGDSRFEAVTRATGTGHPGFASSAAFFDADLDGDLDLYAVNYLVWSVETEKACFNPLGQRDYCAPARYDAPAADVLYRNDGGRSFVDVSTSAGLDRAFGTGLGVVCGDFTGDGLPDVFVANDGMPDQLWVNTGDCRFQDRGATLGCAMDQDGKAKAGMGVAVGDVDDDGDLDLLVCNLRGESDSFFLNEGTYFRDATSAAGLALGSRRFTRFGTGWVDLDNDGILDLYQANGRVASDADVHDPTDPYAEPNLLYRGLRPGVFEEVSPRGGTFPTTVHTSRGVAFGDLDSDGGVDVVVANRDAAPYLLRNVLGSRGHWLLLRLVNGAGSDAIGARVELSVGGRTLRRDLRTAYSYASASDPRIHIGLGTAPAPPTLRVTWPDGVSETFPIPGPDRELTFRRGEGTE